MPSFSLTTASNIFKTKYGPMADATYNSANVLLARVKKDYNFVGDQIFVSVPLSFSGGVGAGTLPVANVASYGKALITAKKMYSVMQYDRESIKASSTLEGAFVKGVDEVTKKGVESFMRFMSFVLFSDGTGILGRVASVSGSGPWVCTMITTVTETYKFKEANFEENDYVDVWSATTGGTLRGTFSVTTVAPGTPSVTVTAVGSVSAPQANDYIVMQNSRNLCPQGLMGVCDATSSTLYNISVGRRWQATQISAADAGITTDIINQLMLEVQRKCGKVPKLILTSFKQYRKILNLLEDQKQYVVQPRMPELQGKVSFRALEFMSAAGPVPIMPERFCDDDRLYALNDDYIVTYHRPDFGFFDDDGTVFLRDATDSYSARYGGYLENYIVPSFQGVITRLA
jgi:hypothetical protein